MTSATSTAGHIPQAAAICFRPLRSGRAEILLITSRSGEWAIPKGRIDPGFTAPEAAANEALEEAGARGQVLRDPVGSFEYLKRGGWASKSGTLCRVEVFPLLVEEVLDEWLESECRQRRWVSARRAPEAVGQAGLARVLSGFPAWLRSVRDL